jgi:adenylate kinase family enzyme
MGAMQVRRFRLSDAEALAWVFHFRSRWRVKALLAGAGRGMEPGASRSRSLFKTGRRSRLVRGGHAVTLDELGSRICIMGPSNSGKSTLAEAISRANGLEAVHLDQLHHLPHTDWLPRPAEEFAALHDAAITGSRWVMEGNYSRLLPQRLARATGFILLDVPTVVSLYRYLRRCWFERDRRGALEGGRDSVKLGMIRHIAVVTRVNRGHYRGMFDDITLPRVQINSTRALADFYRSNGLRR